MDSDCFRPEISKEPLRVGVRCNHTASEFYEERAEDGPEVRCNHTESKVYEERAEGDPLFG